MNLSRGGDGAGRRGHPPRKLGGGVLALIAERGRAGSTTAGGARWGGVSPAARYRHFRDRDELLADVARRGFELFAEALERAWSAGVPDPISAFQGLGAAYLAF